MKGWNSQSIIGFKGLYLTSYSTIAYVCFVTTIMPADTNFNFTQHEYKNTYYPESVLKARQYMRCRRSFD